MFYRLKIYSLMVLAFTVFLASGIGACAKSDVKSPEPAFDRELADTYYAYKHLIKPVQDAHGFIYSDECDSLLFTALTSIGLTGVDIRAAREENGRWHRRPAKDCYPEHSKSTISRDMLLGVLWYAFYHDDLEIVERLWEYGSKRSWIMGDGVRARTQFSPVLVSTLAQLIYTLGGADHAERHLPMLWMAGAEDYEAHLMVLHILLRLRLYGTIEQSAEERLKEHVARQPQNPLFQYAVGNVSEATRLLKLYFPSDRLPNSNDYCTRWLLQRDDGPSWRPCDEGETHSGGELLFLGHLILNG